MSGRARTRAGLGLLSVAGAAALHAGCGGRSGLDAGPPKPPAPECVVDADCLKKVKGADLCHPFICAMEPGDAGAGQGGSGGGGGAGGGSAGSAGSGAAKLVGKCVARPPVNCDDNDPCTTDTCDRTTGLCAYTPSTFDRDGDGYKGPLPGFVAGSPGSCGDDCDDTNPNVHPGATDACGVDNDCDGLAEQSPIYLPIPGADERISGSIAPADPGGLAFSGASFAGTYTGNANGFNVYLSTLGPSGGVLNPPGEQPVTLQSADASGGPILWIGDRYGLAWQDRRSGDYQIYFTVLDAAGTKKHADTQLTFAQGFSVNPAMAWNGSEFLVVWQDDRDGTFNLFGQRVDADSAPIGGNVQLTMDQGALGNEAPSVAVGLKTVGVAWALGDAMSHLIQFQALSPDLGTPVAPPITVSSGATEAVYPNIVWNKDRYVVAWFDKSASPKAIYAAAVKEDGTLITPATAITHPGAFRSRYPFLRPLGDRLLLAFSDDRDQNGGYEIYTRMITPDLAPLGGEIRVTDAPHDSLYPIASTGPQGFLGILFRDDRDGGEHNIYFTRLACVPGP